GPACPPIPLGGHGSRSPGDREPPSLGLTTEFTCGAGLFDLQLWQTITARPVGCNGWFVGRLRGGGLAGGVVAGLAEQGGAAHAAVEDVVDVTAQGTA